MKKITITTEAGNVVLTGTTGNTWSIFRFDSEEAINIAFNDAKKNGAAGNVAQWIGENSRKELKEDATAEELWLSVGGTANASYYIYDISANTGKHYIGENGENCEEKGNAQLFDTPEEAALYARAISKAEPSEWALINPIND